MSSAIRQAVRGMLSSIVVRGKVISAAITGGRTMMQVTGLTSDVRDNVELLMPYGLSGVPPAGADLILHSISSGRDHMVATGGDATGTRIPGMVPGDVGLSDGVRIIAIRNGRIEIVSANEVLRKLVTDEFVPLFNSHTHGGVEPGGGTTFGPNATITDAHLTGAMRAGGPA